MKSIHQRWGLLIAMREHSYDQPTDILHRLARGKRFPAISDFPYFSGGFGEPRVWRVGPDLTTRQSSDGRHGAATSVSALEPGGAA